MQQSSFSVALTGGTGFIGQHLVQALTAEGWHVKALTRRRNALPQLDQVHQVEGALEDRVALEELVADVNVVIHAGGLISARNRREFESANVLGTENLVGAVTEQPRPPKVIYISSIAAREPHLSPYAGTKKGGEDRLRELGESVDWQVLRPPVVYGPGDRQTLKLFRLFKRGISLQLGTTGRFSMIFVEDLVAAILFLIQNSAQKSAIFELDDGHPDGYGWSDILTEASTKLNRDIRNIVVPLSVQRLIAALGFAATLFTGSSPVLSQGKINEFAHPDWVSKINLLSDASEWRAKINLQEGISRTIDWYVSERLL